MLAKVLRGFSKHPDVADAAHVGEPTLVDPKPVSATEVTRQTTEALAGPAASPDKNGLAVETVKSGTPGENQAAPRSDAPPAADTPAAGASDAAASTPAADSQPAANELTPNVPANSNPAAASDPNELKPNVPADGGQALPPPAQVNEIQPGAAASPDANSSATAQDGKPASASASSGQELATDADISSSKHKKKKGLKKVVPF
jgi:hypothetical protein